MSYVIISEATTQVSDAQLEISRKAAQALRAVALPVALERTTTPVWPEDENREAAEGRGPVPCLSEDDADITLAKIKVALPDRLQVHRLDSSVTAEAGDGCSGAGGLGEGEERIGLQTPISFSSPDDVILRRVSLRLVIQGSDDETPVVVYMKPRPDIDLKSAEVIKLEADVAKLAATALPFIKDVFTARVGFDVDTTKVSPRVEAAGLLRHECSWRISDPKLVYDCQPALVVQHRAKAELKVLAEVHVEVRRKMLGGVWHRTYGKNARSMWYLYRPGNVVMAAFDYLDQLAWNERAARVARPYGADDDASAAMLHLAEALKRNNANSAESRDWLRRACDAGNAGAAYSLASAFADEGSFDEARSLFEKAEALGDADARQRLNFLDIEKERYLSEQALRQAAGAGSTEAMVELAQLLRHRGYPDAEEAERWLRRAVDAGSDAGMYHLGESLDERARRTCDGDLRKESEAWYRSAARLGNVLAKKKLVEVHPWRFWYRFR